MFECSNFLAENIRILRKNLSMTQTDLANALGVINTTICNYESGYSQPSVDDCIHLAQVFGCSLDDLILKPMHVLCFHESDFIEDEEEDEDEANASAVKMYKKVDVFSHTDSKNKLKSIIIPLTADTDGNVVGIEVPESRINIGGTYSGDIIIVYTDPVADFSGKDILVTDKDNHLICGQYDIISEKVYFIDRKTSFPRLEPISEMTPLGFIIKGNYSLIRKNSYNLSKNAELTN